MLTGALGACICVCVCVCMNMAYRGSQLCRNSACGGVSSSQMTAGRQPAQAEWRCVHTFPPWPLPCAHFVVVTRSTALPHRSRNVPLCVNRKSLRARNKNWLLINVMSANRGSLVTDGPAWIGMFVIWMSSALYSILVLADVSVSLQG